MSHLRNIKRLARLDSSWTNVSSEGLSPLRSCRQLEQLIISQVPRVDDCGLQYLSELGRLELLDLSGTNITDDGLSQLASLRSLRVLRVEGTSITGTGLAWLEPLAQLSDLDIRTGRVSDDGLAAVARLSTLEYLSIRGAYSPVALGHLCALHSLKHLRIGNRVTGDHLAAIAASSSLESLRLDDEVTLLDDDDLEAIARKSRLKKLWFGPSIEVTDASLKYLSRMRSVELIDVRGTSMSRNAVKSAPGHVVEVVAPD